jgi:hypothetical protein
MKRLCFIKNHSNYSGHAVCLACRRFSKLLTARDVLDKSALTNMSESPQATRSPE